MRGGIGRLITSQAKRSGHILLSAGRKHAPKMYEHFKKQRITRREYNGRVLCTLLQSMRSVVEQLPSLLISPDPSDLDAWVGRRQELPSFGEYGVLGFTDTVGFGIPHGKAVMSETFLVQGSHDSTSGQIYPPNTALIFLDSARIQADVILYVALSDPIMEQAQEEFRAAASLQGLSTPELDEKTYGACCRLILMHEVGHLDSDRRFAEIARGRKIGGWSFVFESFAMEIAAESRLLEHLEAEDDPLLTAAYKLVRLSYTEWYRATSHPAQFRSAAAHHAGLHALLTGSGAGALRSLTDELIGFRDKQTKDDLNEFEEFLEKDLARRHRETMELLGSPGDSPPAPAPRKGTAFISPDPTEHP